MSSTKYIMLAVGAAAFGLTAGSGNLAEAQQASDVIGELANNQGIFVDGKTFEIVRGSARETPPPTSLGWAPRRLAQAQ